MNFDVSPNICTNGGIIKRDEKKGKRKPRFDCELHYLTRYKGSI